MSKPKKIVFQGEPGANSHIAITEAYPNAEAVPCPTFEDALAAIASGEADGTWALFSALPAGLKPVLLYESAANVLRGGSPDDGGRISYQGESYVIESSFDGNAWTAKVSGSR